MKITLRLFFITLFFAAASYIIYFQTERYESKSIVLLKDLAGKQEMDMGSMIMSQDTGNMQDSKLLELYMQSHEMFDYLEKKFHLSDYYTGEKVDFLQRLYKDTHILPIKASKANLLKKYQNDLSIVYDEPTGTLSIDFANADRNTSKQILQAILERASEVINHLEKENAKIALRFIENQKKKNKAIFVDSIKKLIQYQDKHHTIDPNLDVAAKSTILANLESDLIQKKVEYTSNLKFFNKNTVEMKLLKDTMQNIQKSIAKIKAQMTGTNNNISELNTNVFDFELIKSDMDFNKEIYQQTLASQEELKIEVSQNAKNLIIISTPTLADEYAYPDKIMDILTLFLVLILLYGIFATIITLLKEHKD